MIKALSFGLKQVLLRIDVFFEEKDDDERVIYLSRSRGARFIHGRYS
jgi:hypothetical protein